MKEEEFERDNKIPTIAPYETSPQNPWWYISKSDSTMIGLETFLKTNYSSAPVELKKAEKVDRTTLRKMLYEYLLTEMRFNKHSRAQMEDETTKYFLVGKGVKDYLIYTKKTEFTYQEVEELLESKAILCFINFMINEMLSEIYAWEHTNLCESRDCTIDLYETNNYGRWKADSALWQVYKYLETRNSSHLFETFTTFDDWSQFIPLVDLEAEGKDLSFFTLPPGRRNVTDLSRRHNPNTNEV